MIPLQAPNPNAKVHHSVSLSPTSTFKELLNPNLSLKDQLIEIGMLDNEGRLTFKPTIHVPSLEKSLVSSKRLEQLLKTHIPSLGITLEKYVDSWNQMVTEVLGISMITYLRGGSAFYVIDLPLMLKLLIENYAQDSQAFEEPLKEIRKKWLEEEPPADIDLLDLCNFDKTALIYLTKKHLTTLTGLSLVEVEAKFPRLTYPGNPRPLYPPPQEMLIFTLEEESLTIDRVTGNPERKFMFSRDDARITLTNGLHTIVSSSQNIWQTVIDRIFQQVRFNEEHIADFQSGLAALQLISNRHTLYEEKDSLTQCLSQAGHPELLAPLIASIKNRLLKHQCHPLFFVISVCQRLEPFLHEDLIETVYKEALKGHHFFEDCSFKEALASLYALALIYHYYENPESEFQVTFADHRLTLATEAVQLQLDPKEYGPLHKRWIEQYLDLKKLRLRPRCTPRAYFTVGHPVLDLLLSRASLKPLTPLSETFLRHLETVFQRGLLTEEIACLLLPDLEICAPYNRMSVVHALANKGHKKEAAAMLTRYFLEEIPIPTMEELDAAWKILERKKREDLFKELIEHQKLSDEALAKYYPLLIQNPDTEYWKQERGNQWLSERNFSAFFHFYKTSDAHPAYEMAVLQLIEHFDSETLVYLLKTNERALIPHFAQLFKTVVMVDDVEVTAELLKEALTLKHTDSFYEWLLKCIPGLTMGDEVAQKFVRPLLESKRIANMPSTHESAVRCIVAKNIKASSQSLKSLRPTTPDTYQCLRKLGYFSGAEAKSIATFVLVQSSPDEFLALNPQDKALYLKSLTRDQANAFTEHAFQSPLFPFEMKLKIARELNVYHWNSLLDEMKRMKEPEEPLKCLMKQAIRITTDSSECWRYALDQFFKKPRKLKEAELKTLLNALNLLYPDPEKKLEVELQLLTLAQPSQMPKETIARSMQLVKRARSENCVKEVHVSIYKIVVQALIAKPSLTELILKAANHFELLPSSKEHAALLMQFLKMKDLIYEAPFYSCFGIQAEHLVKPQIFLALYDNLIHSARGLQLSAMLELWADHPSLSHTFLPILVRCMLVEAWHYNKDDNKLDSFTYSLEKIYHSNHGSKIKEVRFVYHYLTLIQRNPITSAEFMETLDFLSTVIATVHEKRRREWYADFTRYIMNSLTDVLTESEKAEAYRRLVEMITRNEAGNGRSLLNEELALILGMILNSLIDSREALCRKDCLKNILKLLTSYEVKFKTLDAYIPFLENLMLLGVSIGDSSLMKELQSYINTIQLRMNTWITSYQIIGFFYWASGTATIEAGKKLDTEFEFAGKAIAHSVITLCKHLDFNCFQHAAQIIHRETVILKRQPEERLLQMIKGFLDHVKKARTAHPEKKEEWELLVTNFAVDVIHTLSLICSGYAMRSIKSNELLPEEQCLHLEEMHQEFMTKLSSNAQ